MQTLTSTRRSLTIEEASEYTGLPVATLRWKRAKGEGPIGYLLGRRLRYDREDLDAWIAAQKAATAR